MLFGTGTVRTRHRTTAIVADLPQSTMEPGQTSRCPCGLLVHVMSAGYPFPRPGQAARSYDETSPRGFGPPADPGAAAGKGTCCGRGASRLGATGSQHLRVLDVCPGCRGADPSSEARRPADGDCLHRVRQVREHRDDTCASGAEAAEQERGRGPSCSGWDDTDGQKKYGQLTEQITEYFAAADDVDVRALDMAAALGRDSDSESINGVRRTLERRESATNEGFGSAESAKATHR